MSDAIDATAAWIEAFVVGLDLCPFAAGPLRAGRVRVTESRADGGAEVLAELLGELELLEADDEVETSLLVIPQLGLSFDDFLDLVGAAEGLLEVTGKDGSFQLAHFHPDYAFDGAPEDDPANATNRAPHPTIHVLRVDSVSRAVDSHPDAEGIPARNVELLRRRAERG